MIYKILVLLLCVFIKPASAKTTPPLKPTNLTCEYQQNPIGIDVAKPRLSWNFISAERNQSQTAYQIIVSDNEKDNKAAKGNVWQTGKILSADNIHIEYAGNSLQPFTKYYWRVKWYDKNGIASDWSQTVIFESAALQASDWQAKWIGDGSKQFDKDEDFYKDDAMPLFRKQISITKK